MSGWVCSYRSIWDHPFFKGSGMRVAVWHWLLHHAAWQDCPHVVSGIEITVQRGEVCFTQQQISDDTGASRKQVREVLEYLISAGSAVKVGANNRANGGANVRANAKSLYLIANYDKYQVGNGRGANETAKAGATEGPTKEQENKPNKKKEEANASSGHGAAAPDGFDEFWSAWPLRKQKKADAQKAFKKLSAKDRDAATQRVAAWAALWRQAHPTASDIHPTSYLNGKRWEDEASKISNVVPLPGRPAQPARDVDMGYGWTWTPGSPVEYNLKTGDVRDAKHIRDRRAAEAEIALRGCL